MFKSYFHIVLLFSILSVFSSCSTNPPVNNYITVDSSRKQTSSTQEATQNIQNNNGIEKAQVKNSKERVVKSLPHSQENNVYSSSIQSQQDIFIDDTEDIEEELNEVIEESQYIESAYTPPSPPKFRLTVKTYPNNA